MTALSADKKLRMVASAAARSGRGKVNGGSKIYKGGALVVDTDGYLRPGVDTSNFQFVGWADESVDNTDGDDGDVWCKYITGVIVEMENYGTYPVEQSDLYKPCYLKDDATVQANVSNGVIAGIAMGITAAGKIEVYGSPELATLAPSGEASLMKMFVITDAAAKGTNNVHALIDSSATTDVTTGFTNPDVPRNLRVVKSSSWDGGVVTVSGTDQYDNPVTETFTALTAGTETGVKVFKTVTSCSHDVALAGGAGYSIGTGDKLGIVGNIAAAVGTLLAGTTAEAVTVDATYDAFTPTTAPDGSVDFTFATNIVVETD